MNYEQTLAWMFGKLPMYQRQGKKAFKKDLNNTLLLAERLGNPQKKFKSIHVGGTNGKGSTSHMIASILQEAGYKVGLYTSPHLKNYTERIRINGTEINADSVTTFINQHQSFLENQGLSFFEMTVGLAFWYFANEKVDFAVIEVGLGGRLDSTNIICPEVSVITNIGLDHTQMLGETLPEIASEKAGIIKKNTPIIIGERQKEIQDVFINKANEQNAEITFASDNSAKYQTDLLGNYQIKNSLTAVTAVKKILKVNISNENIQKGLLNVVKNTNLKGRWQILQVEKPKVICDTAHNTAGLTYVIKQLEEEKYEQLHIVLGMVADKNIDEILRLFPKEATYYFCKPNIPRGLCEKKLQQSAANLDLKGNTYQTVQSAYNQAKNNATSKDLIYIGGSTFVVAEIL